MRTILVANNRDILREIKSLRDCLQGSPFPQELNGYCEWVLSFLKEKERMVIDNLHYLSLNVDSILSEVMERTQSVTLNIRILSAKYISPLSRYSKSDNLSIMLLKWLHDQHPQSKDVPFAVSDGNFSIYPSTDIPVIYYLPASSQKSLLHLPLFFHEYGHYLFEFHRKEMIDYIIYMQDGMEELLLQPFQQNDAKFHRERAKAKNIIETWYDWIEEIFCDLVGLTIGGSAFLKTFSMYLRMSGREAFYLSDKELENTTHPVSWIRIKFLVDRARKMNLVKEADLVEKEWKKMAELMNMAPTYHGYYSGSYDNLINEALDSMLEEANPIKYTDFVFCTEGYIHGKSNFIELMIEAWLVQENKHEEYETWEKGILEVFTNNTAENPYPLHGNADFIPKNLNKEMQLNY